MSEMFRTPSCVANVWMLYLRSPSTSGRSCTGSRELAQQGWSVHTFVMAITVANRVTKQVINTMAGLHCSRRCGGVSSQSKSWDRGADLEWQEQRSTCGVKDTKVEKEAPHGRDDQERRQREALSGALDHRAQHSTRAARARTFSRNGGTL